MPRHIGSDGFLDGIPGICPECFSAQTRTPASQALLLQAQRAAGCAERGRLGDECLNEHWFLNFDHARELMEAWRRE